MKHRELIVSTAICFAPVLGMVGPQGALAAQEVEEREVRFENDGIELVGTLHVPPDAVHGPAIVVTHGAGPGERDFPLYAQFADLLPRIGYSVFVYDRRGAGASGGRREGASYEELAGDAVAARRAVAEYEAVDPDRIGFWGLSQGGWIVMEAAAMSEPAFAISVSAPLTTPGRQMEVLAYNLILEEGYDEAVAERARDARRTVDAYYRGDISHESARASLAEIEAEPWYEFTYLPAAEDLPEDVEETTWIHEMDYDPTAAFSELETPLLFILGGADSQIPVDETMEIIDELPPDEGRKVVVVPGADHLLRIAEADEPVSDSSAYFLVMAHWLGTLETARE